MKKFTRLLALSLLVVMTVSMLVSCGSTYGKIEKNFKEIGYTPSEQANDDAKKYTDELNALNENEDKITVTVRVFESKKDIPIVGEVTYYVTVLEFGSEGDLEEALGNSETLKGLIKDAQNSEYVNGNCVLIPPVTALTDWEDIKVAFKK